MILNMICSQIFYLEEYLCDFYQINKLEVNLLLNLCRIAIQFSELIKYDLN